MSLTRPAKYFTGLALDNSSCARDGLIEAQNQDCEEFGPARLEYILSTTPASQRHDALIAAVHLHMSGLAAHDDVSLATIDCLLHAAEEAEPQLEDEKSNPPTLEECACRTGEGNKTAEAILESAKAAVDEQKKRNETDGKIAEATEGSKGALEKSVEVGGKIETAVTGTKTAAEAVVSSLDRQNSTLTQVEGVLRKMRDQVDRNTTNIQRLLDAAALKAGS